MSQTLVEPLKATGFTKFPCSAFFFKIVPEMGARKVQFSNRHLDLLKLASAWTTAARAISMRSLRGPSFIMSSDWRSFSTRLRVLR